MHPRHRPSAAQETRILIAATPDYVKARYRLTLPGGERCFLKVYHAPGSYARLQAARERASLKILAGLAVPKLLSIRARAARRILGFLPKAYLAQSLVRGVRLDHAGLSPAQLLGAWLFLAEQLAVFRRRNVFYTDIKCSNVLAIARPLKVTQIDFNLATGVRRSRSYPARWIGYTLGLQAPEHLKSGRLTERTVVFQLGMLLAEAWLGLENSDLYGPGRGLQRLRQKIRNLGSPRLADLVTSCLSKDLGKRPRDYEQVFERIRALESRGIPAAVRRVWESLRAPYAKQLEARG